MTVILAIVMLVGQVGTVQEGGDANFANPSHGSDYLAMRLPRGTIVTITGAGGSWTAPTTDYGPVLATGDIADIALVKFARICGWTIAHARLMGECSVTVEYGGPRLPETDVAYWTWPNGRGPR